MVAHVHPGLGAGPEQRGRTRARSGDLRRCSARIQQGTSAIVEGWRGVWAKYIALRGVRQENEALKQRVAELEVQLQQEHALASAPSGSEAARHEVAATVPTVAAEVIAGDPTPGMPAIWIDKGERRRRSRRHGGHRAGRRRRARDRAGRAVRGAGAADHRSERGRRRDDRTVARRRCGRRALGAIRRCGWSTCRTWRTSRRRSGRDGGHRTASTRRGSRSGASKSPSAAPACIARSPCGRSWTSRTSRKCSSC